jgi:Glycosyl hydrolase family 12
MAVCLAGVIWASTADAGTFSRARLMVSTQPDRSSPVALDGARLGGLAYIFVRPGRDRVRQVVFTLDPGTPGERREVRTVAPFDFDGTNADATARPLDVSTLAEGSHTMTAEVSSGANRVRVLTARFQVPGGSTTPPSTTEPSSTPATTTVPPTSSSSTTTTQTPSTTTRSSTTTTTAPPSTPPPSSACTNPAYVTSDPFGGISRNGYYVYNDAWNTGEAGPQTMYVCNHNNWYVDSTQANTTSVKTYPNVHKDINNQNGLPYRDFSTITSTFAGRGPQVGSYNVAYDIWLNGVGQRQGVTEVMIWTERFNAQPWEVKEATVTISGSAWDVWRYYGGPANYIAFVPQGGPLYSGSLNLKAFIDWGISAGKIPQGPTINAIGYGCEFRSTNNTRQRFTLTDFSVTMG